MKPWTAATVLALATAGLALPASAVAASDARIVGTFAMSAHVLDAVGVPGERRGQTLHRTWTAVPAGCTGSVCTRLILLRERGSHLVQRVSLRRTAPGRYAGQGVFYVALRCGRRIYRLGSQVPFRITVTVGAAVAVQGIEFARTLSATYVNPRRSDATPCPLGPVHERAAYSGRAITPLPSPPSAAFAATVDNLSDEVAFRDTSARGTGGAALSGWRWYFGDPASGSANTAAVPDPTHHYPGPGTYTVQLIVQDANGLTSSVQQQVTIPAVQSSGPPPAAA